MNYREIVPPGKVAMKATINRMLGGMEFIVRNDIEGKAFVQHLKNRGGFSVQCLPLSKSELLILVNERTNR